MQGGIHEARRACQGAGSACMVWCRGQPELPQGLPSPHPPTCGCSSAVSSSNASPNPKSRVGTCPLSPEGRSTSTLGPN